MAWKRFVRRKQWDQERSRELENYLAIEENVAHGMSTKEARFAARRKLGNLTLIREEIYGMNSIALVETLWQGLALQPASDRGRSGDRNTGVVRSRTADSKRAL